MKRTAKKEVESLLNEYAAQLAEQRRLEAKQERLLKPHADAYAEATRSIYEQTQPKITAQSERIGEIQHAITTTLNAAIVAGEPLPQVTTPAAIAEVTQTTRRELSPRGLFDAVPEAKHDASFWDCFTVLIGKAEKFLGSEIDRLARPKTSHKVSIRLRD